MMDESRPVCVKELYYWWWMRRAHQTSTRAHRRQSHPKCVSLNPPSLESQTAARGTEGGKEELIQTSSLAQLALIANRWTPAALLKFDYSLQRLGWRGLRSASKDVKQVVSHEPRIFFCVFLAVFLGQNLMDRTIRLNQTWFGWICQCVRGDFFSGLYVHDTPKGSISLYILLIFCESPFYIHFAYMQTHLHFFD